MIESNHISGTFHNFLATVSRLAEAADAESQGNHRLTGAQNVTRHIAAGTGLVIASTGVLMRRSACRRVALRGSIAPHCRDGPGTPPPLPEHTISHAIMEFTP